MVTTHDANGRKPMAKTPSVVKNDYLHSRDRSQPLKSTKNAVVPSIRDSSSTTATRVTNPTKANTHKKSIAAIGKKHHQNDDISSPPTSRQRTAYETCCDCSRSSSCHRGRTKASEGCACVNAGRNCVNCSCFNARCKRNPRLLKIAPTIEKGVLPDFFSCQATTVKDQGTRAVEAPPQKSTNESSKRASKPTESTLSVRSGGEKRSDAQIHHAVAPPVPPGAKPAQTSEDESEGAASKPGEDADEASETAAPGALPNEVVTNLEATADGIDLDANADDIEPAEPPPPPPPPDIAIIPDAGADLEGYVLTSADEKLKAVFGDHAHANDDIVPAYADDVGLGGPVSALPRANIL